MHKRVQRRERDFLEATELRYAGYADSITAKSDDRFDLSFGACGLPSVLCNACFGDNHHVIILSVYDSIPPYTIRQLADLPHLQGLRIGGNVQPFERFLPRLRRLRYLDLTGTRATDHTISLISGMNELRQLRLGHTFVSDECIADLAQLQQLDSLGIKSTRISDAGLERLRQALPDCCVFGYPLMNTRRQPPFSLNRVADSRQFRPGAGNRRPEVSERRHLRNVLRHSPGGCTRP